MKRIVWSSILLVFGILVIAGGISSMGSSTVECGGRVMTQSDTCVETRNGQETGHVYTYEDQKKSGRGQLWLGVGVGGLMVVLGAVSLVIGIRNRRRNPPVSAAQPGFPPQQQAAYPQQAQPGYPPQAYPPQNQQQPGQWPH